MATHHRLAPTGAGKSSSSHHTAEQRPRLICGIDALEHDGGLLLLLFLHLQAIQTRALRHSSHRCHGKQGTLLLVSGQQAAPPCRAKGASIASREGAPAALAGMAARSPTLSGCHSLLFLKNAFLSALCSAPSCRGSHLMAPSAGWRAREAARARAALRRRRRQTSAGWGGRLATCWLSRSCTRSGSAPGAPKATQAALDGRQNSSARPRLVRRLLRRDKAIGVTHLDPQDLPGLLARELHPAPQETRPRAPPADSDDPSRG